MKKYIPNTLTCCNLFCGCLAVVCAFGEEYGMAFVWIAGSAVFDFLDGMMARLLHAYSDIGKDLDSLADNVSFGFAPAAIVFMLLSNITCVSWLPYVAFLISIFSALRLAKFNNDTRQTSSFRGLPVPANALFWAAGVYAYGGCIMGMNAQIVVPILIVLIVLFSYLLVSEVPMFSLKAKSLKWGDNQLQYIYLIGCVLLLVALSVYGIALMIVWYIVLSLIQSVFTAPQHK